MDNRERAAALTKAELERIETFCSCTGWPRGEHGPHCYAHKAKWLLEDSLRARALGEARAAIEGEGTRELVGRNNDGTYALAANRCLERATAELVRDFAQALMDKLYDAEQKYGYSDGWRSTDWMDECRQKLRNHLEKGDPCDVAAYCAFLWYHKESTALSTPTSSRACPRGGCGRRWRRQLD